VVTVGMTIGGRFRVDELLGAGGMGIVVAATHLELGHRVAIKLLRDEMAASATVVERFLREARSVVHLRTEHVCRVTDVGRLDTGAPYIVMELLEGSDLGRVVAKQALPTPVAVAYILQACIGLAEAHAAGIVHRDLKPANLFLTRRTDGSPLIKVLDFGIAKALSETGAQLTHSHSVLGSPGYISPEQLQSARDVDVRTDIWALGVTLYQLLSARLPFYRANATDMAVRIVTEPPDPLDVDPALRAAVFRCLEKSPAERYDSVVALAADLVVFGGPSAQGIAALISQAAARSRSRSVPLPMVSALAPTAAASLASHAGDADAPDTDRVEPPHRISPRRVLVPLLVLAAVAAAAVSSHNRGSSKATAVQTAESLAGDGGATAPGLNGARVTAAAVAPPPDAAPLAPSGPRDAGPRSSGSRPSVSRDPGNRPRANENQQLANLMAMAPREKRTACLPITKPTAAGPMLPLSIVVCWCAMKDQPHAQAAFAKLAASPARDTIRTYCRSQGIKLP
jgi:hypothetical protein